MKQLMIAVVVALLSGACSGRGPQTPDPTPPPTSQQTPPPPPPTTVVTAIVVVSAAGQLGDGLDLFVNTDRGRTDWVSPTADGFQAAYPSGQVWGFVGAVVKGDAAIGSRPGRDLSAQKTLQMQLRGASGNETVDVGIKDSADPDDGTETRKTVVLTSSWQTYSFPLTDFRMADRQRIYLLFELVFNGAPARTVYFRDIQYVP